MPSSLGGVMQVEGTNPADDLQRVLQERLAVRFGPEISELAHG